MLFIVSVFAVFYTYHTIYEFHLHLLSQALLWCMLLAQLPMRTGQAQCQKLKPEGINAGKENSSQ